ncbi:hypothetical protein ACT43Q_06860 [Acinetobacter baumannii]
MSVSADNTLPTLADGPHTITVTATDAAGNVGNDTAVVTRYGCTCTVCCHSSTHQ